MSFSAGHCYSSPTARHHHSKLRNPINSYRRRRQRAPGTPVSQWKDIDEGHRGSGGEGVELSARKLAAGLWQLQLLAEISCGGGGGGGGGSRVKFGSCNWLKFQPPTDAEHVSVALPWHRYCRKYGFKSRDLWQSPLLNCSPKHKIRHKHESSFPNPKSAVEKATQWDPRCSKNSTEAYYFDSHMKLLEGQATTVSIVSALQAEVVQAQLRLLQLEDEYQLCKKRFEHLMRKLGEERKSRRSREQHNIHAVIDGFKDELSMERKSRRKIEMLNSKLVKELADSESAAKQLMQDYKKEKRGREIMEEVCNELAKKIGEDRAELEGLKCEAMKIREEVEEERRMLQLAEVWREERVQMKLIDAKLALERKYNQMNKLVADLESFLTSQTAPLDIMEPRRAELIIQMVKSVNIHNIKEFEYVPPKSSGIFSVFEELQRGEANERKNTPVGHASNHQIVCHEVNKYSNNYELNHSNGLIVVDSDLEPDSKGEARNHIEDKGSGCSYKRSDHSAVNLSRGKFAIIECNDNGGQNSPNTKPRSAFLSNPKLREITSDDGSRRLSSGTVSSVGTNSSRRKSADIARRQRNYMGKLVSPDSENPHTMQGMKGFINSHEAVARMASSRSSSKR